MTPYFFGYGSLVNHDTHIYQNTHKASLSGWRRAWVRTAGREVAYLTAVPDKDSKIEGSIAAVPHANWAALDERERGYTRLVSGNSVSHPLSKETEIAHYVVPTEAWITTGDHVILQSYLDVVVQGYLREFGPQGVTDFFETTEGWDLPVLNDRAAPKYPRHQSLSQSEQDIVDMHLATVQSR